MTLLEDKAILLPRKLSLKGSSSSASQSLKRKSAFPPQAPLQRKKFLHDYNNMLNGYKSEHSSRGGPGDASHDAPVATLSNMGNTCFLNSVLYTLRFAPTFLHNLHHLIGDLALVSARLSQTKAKTSSLGRNVGSITGPSSRSTSSKDLLSLTSDSTPKSRVQVVTEKLHELFITMHNLEVKDSSDAYQPVALLQAVREANYIFEGNHQQDAHELLVYLLDNIRETCDLLTKQVQQHPGLLNEIEIIPTNDTQHNNNNNSKLWSVRRSWKKNQSKKQNKQPPSSKTISEEHVNGSHVTDTEDASSIDSTTNTENCTSSSLSASNKKKLGYNFVAEDFEGITLRRTICLECESVTERKEPFYDIPVPIIAAATSTAKENEFDESGAGNPNEIFKSACVTLEKLCDSNKYLCETCQRYNEANREVLFERLPNIMVLQLKRFTTTSSAGVQKVNTYLPTPLELECFCETCTKAVKESEIPPHRYRLCCVIMHLGASMASGHYIAYVKASDHLEDYAECSRNVPKGSLSASSSEKSLNFLKFLKQRTIGGSLAENKSMLSSSSSKNNMLNGVRMCKSMDCCGVKLNKSLVENNVNAYSTSSRRSKMQQQQQDFSSSGVNHTNGSVDNNGGGGNSSSSDVWLECDDESVRPITSTEFEEELSYKPNSTSTPYLLFYAKISDVALDE